MRRLVKQRGFSSLSWLVILLVSIFFLRCAFRLVPFYVDNMTVRSALSSLAQNPALSTMTKSEIRRELNNYLYINNLQGKSSQAVSIKETPKTLFIDVNYEERANIIFNIDAVVVFKNQLDVNNPDLCCDPQ